MSIVINGVLQANAVCERCGSAIKNVYTFGGKQYGSECVKVVSGLEVKHLGSVRDLDKLIEDQNKRAAKEGKRIEEIKAIREKWTQVNGWLIGFLREQSTQNGDFCYNMAFDLELKSIDELSDKQYHAIANIYAKVRGGRVGSKKYEQAYDEFVKLCGCEEEQQEQAEARSGFLQSRKVKNGYKVTLILEDDSKIVIGTFEEDILSSKQTITAKMSEQGWLYVGGSRHACQKKK